MKTLNEENRQKATKFLRGLLNMVISEYDFSRPAKILTNVVFPDPLGPAIVTHDPRSMLMLKSSNINLFLYLNLKFLISSTSINFTS